MELGKKVDDTFKLMFLKGQNPGAGRPLVTLWIKCLEMTIHFVGNRHQRTFCPGF